MPKSSASVTIRNLRRDVKTDLVRAAKQRGVSLESHLREVLEREATVARVMSQGGRGRLIPAPNGAPFFVMPDVAWPKGFMARRSEMYGDDER